MNLTLFRITGLLAVLSSFCPGQTVITSGLQSPQKLIMTPRGNFLVAETSPTVNSGRVSFVSRAGARRSLFEGMPSGAEVTGGPSGPIAMALRDRTLYLAIGPGDTERAGLRAGTTQHNPDGVSSPIYCSIMEIRFNADIDALTGTFKLTTSDQQNLADGYEIELQDGAAGRATASLLVDLPNSLPDANALYKFSNPWGMALSADGAALWVTDASQNCLLKVNTATGRFQRVMRFGPLPNIGLPVGPPVIDIVPTGVRVYGNQILVSFLTGFPFTPGYARVMVVTPDAKTAEPFINGLTSAVDILHRARPDGRPQFFALEFSTNQSATPAAPGRLLRYDSPVSVVVANDLRAPVSMAFDAATEELFVLELSGRLLSFSAK